jgi:site-specific recombinase XerD
MFQKLFKRPHAIKKQLTGPLLEERLQFLVHCEEHGAARSTLREIAIYQLIVIDCLKLLHKGIITLTEIEAAAECWAQRQTRFSRLRDKPSPFPKARLIKHARHWLSFLGRLQKTGPPAHPFAQAISEFANFMREERDLSSATISYRCRELESYLAQFSGQQLSLADVTITHLDDVLLRRITQARFARCTVQTHASTLRAFFRYAEQRGWCRRGLADAIRAPRVYRHETLPFSPSWEDVHRLLDSTADARPADIRDRAILLLLSVYGLRVGEVCRLQLDDLDWERELLRIKRIKQGPVQQLPLSHTVGDAILRYLQEVRPHGHCRELFLNLRAPLRPLTRGAVGLLVSRRWRTLDVVLEHHGPHSLRHACATRLINQGASLKEIGDQLGHRDVETTLIYAKVDLPHLREVANFDLGGVLCD